MVEGIRVLEEGVIAAGDCQLYLTEHAVILDIDEYIVGALAEPVYHSHQLHTLAVLAHPHDLVVDPQDLLLPRGTLATDQVHHLKRHNAARTCS